MEHLRNESADSKILFTGLDGAGKTSIILALRREFSKIANLEPTRGAQRRSFNYLGKSIVEWDLGGQHSYRISYLKSPTKYFDGTEVAIYVIDVQQRDRIQESLSYLIDVVVQFSELGIRPPIYVFFHKCDPSYVIEGSGEYGQTFIMRNRRELEAYLLDLRKEVSGAVQYDDLFFFNTSIYNLPSIVSAMSRIMLALYPKALLLRRTAEEFALKSGSYGVQIIDGNSLVLASYYRDKAAEKMLGESSPYLLTLLDRFKRLDGELTAEAALVIQRLENYFVVRQFSIQGESESYYLSAMRKNPDIEEEHYSAFVNLLREVLAR